MPSSAACPPAEKKNKRILVIAIKAPIPALGSSSIFSPSVSDNFTLTSEGASSSLRLNPNDPETFPSEPEPESVALRVVNKPKEEEEDMSNDLRTGFKERHRKCLHEAIDMVPPPAKRACSEGVREELGREVPSMPVPLPNVVGPSSMPTTEEKAGLAPRGASGGVALPEKVLN